MKYMMGLASMEPIWKVLDAAAAAVFYLIK